MSISLLTAMTIQSRSVRCEAGGPSETHRKYIGWIMLDVPRWHPLLNTEPVYESAEDAVKAMEEVVAAVRRADLNPPLGTLVADEMAIVGQIVAAAHAGDGSGP